MRADVKGKRSEKEERKNNNKGRRIVRKYIPGG